MKLNFYLFILLFFCSITFLFSQENQEVQQVESPQETNSSIQKNTGEMEDNQKKSAEPLTLSEIYYQKLNIHPYNIDELENQIENLDNFNQEVAHFFIAKKDSKGQLKSISQYVLEKDFNGNTILNQKPYLTLHRLAFHSLNYYYNESGQLIKKEFLNELDQLIEYNDIHYDDINSKNPSKVEVYEINWISNNLKKTKIFQMQWKNDQIEIFSVYNSLNQKIEEYNFIDNNNSINLFHVVSNSSLGVIGNFSIAIENLKKYSRYYFGNLNYYITYDKLDNKFHSKKYNEKNVLIRSNVINLDKQPVEEKSKDINSKNEEKINQDQPQETNLDNQNKQNNE